VGVFGLLLLHKKYKEWKGNSASYLNLGEEYCDLKLILGGNVGVKSSS
jgi:hypothetical protein